MRSRSVCASSKTLRASMPTTGSAKISGYFPLNSQVRKNGDQSMNGTISPSGTSSRTRMPVKLGEAMGTLAPIGRERVPAGLGERHELAPPALRERHALRSCAARFSLVDRLALFDADQAIDDADAPRSVFHMQRPSRDNAARSSPRCAWRWSSRRRSGAGSGTLRAPSRLATCTISSSDGVISPDRPIMSTLCSRAVFKIFRKGPSRRGRSPRNRCSPGRRRRCSCRCRGRLP